MSKQFATAALGFGLALLCVSPGLAGSMGNGAAQRRAAFGPHPEGPVATQYVYCYGGNPHSVYFSAVFAAPSTRGPVDLSSSYGHYLTQRGYKSDGAQCIHATARADASAAKTHSEDEFRSGRTIVETSWQGG